MFMGFKFDQYYCCQRDPAPPLRLDDTSTDNPYEALRITGFD